MMVMSNSWKIGLTEIVKSWADNIDRESYKLSPLYGDNKNLPII